MKKKFNLFNIIIILYLLFHIAYTAYMFTQAVSYGLIWLAISLIEIILFYLGIKKHKIIKFLLATVLIIQSVFSLSIMFMGIDTKTSDADYVLVLGYQLKDNQMSKTLEYRLDKAYKYSQNNPDSIIILCGGITHKNTVSEAAVMYYYLVEKGVDANRIKLEDQSTDTIENIQNSLNYIDTESKIVILSSNYHVYRAKQIANKAGIEAKGIGSKAPILLIPNQLLFEKIGLLKMMLFM